MTVLAPLRIKRVRMKAQDWRKWIIIMENVVMANIDMNKNLICDDDLEFVSGGFDPEEYKKMIDRSKNAPKPMGPKSNPGKNDDYFESGK